ncbi:MAG: hydrolase [Kiritimatiellia bacterium]
MNKPQRLDADKVVFVLLDVQGKLAQIMHEREILFDNLVRLVRAMRVLHIPVLWLEQLPAKMGPTIPEIRCHLGDTEPIVKSSFSAWGNPEFVRRLRSLGRIQILLAGIETHVCVYQSAVDLLAAGYQVEVVADAVSSRTLANKQVGLEKIQASGGTITCTEMAVFEMLRTAEHPAFREILDIVK